jgi:hypothetical protein
LYHLMHAPLTYRFSIVREFAYNSRKHERGQ